MALHRISSLLLVVATFSCIECSVLAPAAIAAPPPIAYTRVAPLNIPPFAASVNTFTRGLNVYAAPYAAGILPGPAVAARAILPAPGPVPAAYQAAYAAAAPAIIPGGFAAPAAYAAPPAVAPLPVGYAAAPPYFPSPIALGARSVHAVGPGLAPALSPAFAPGYQLPAYFRR